MKPLPLISCLCITRGDIKHLVRSVRCFAWQSYPNKELIIVYRPSLSGDVNKLLLELSETHTVIPVRAQPDDTVGDLRNRALDAAKGPLVANWDDDDWSHPERLKAQQIALHEASIRSRSIVANVLSSVMLYDGVTKEVLVSGQRRWECSMLAVKRLIGYYPSVNDDEDSIFIDRIAKRAGVCRLKECELYVYHYHGGNTGTQLFWEHHKKLGDRVNSIKEEAVRELFS